MSSQLDHDALAGGQSSGDAFETHNDGGANGLDHDTDAALDFLAHWYGDRPRVIVTISPDGIIKRRDFPPGDDAALRVLLDAAQGKLNVYFQPNTATHGLTKAAKEDIREIRCLHVDADFKDFDCDEATVLERLRSVDPPPTVIVFSGGGYQAEWLLETPIPVPNGTHPECQRIEGMNAEIAKIVGAASGCQNIDRLLRLPGTVNVLSTKKRAKGRKPASAYLVEADWTRLVRNGDEPAPGGEGDEDEPESGAGGDGGSFTFEALPEKLQKLITGDAKKYGDHRSRLLFAVLCWLARLGWPAGAMLTIALNPKHETLFKHCQDQRNPQGYARRQIKKAIKQVESTGGAWQLTGDGSIWANSQRNIRKALGLLGHRLSYDQFALAILIDGEPIEDPEAIAAWLAIDEKFKFRPSREFFDAVLIDEAHKHAFHPVLDYLDGLKWDGIKRIDKWLTTYGKVEENEYVKAVGRIVMMAAVRRVRQPGCKFDEMLVLVDEQQGTEKSEAIAALCPNPEWFTDSFRLGSNDKETIETLYGKWIAEIPELAGMRRSEVESIKAQLSRQRDRARLAYGRFRTEAKRQCIFIGTTNELQFLKDNQNRRFWPVHSGRWEVAALRRDRDQLWAEAAAAEAEGESIRLDPSLWAKAGLAQEQHEVVDPWIYAIEREIGHLEGRIKTADLFELLMLPNGAKNPGQGSRINSCMRKLGWENNKGKSMQFANRKDIARGYVRGATQDTRKKIIAVRIEYDDYGNRRLVVNVFDPLENPYDPPLC